MQFPATILALFFFTGIALGHRSEVKKPVAENKFVAPVETLQTGDLVFRNGKGWISDFFRKTSSSHKEYSHVGIIYVSGQNIMVLHMIGDGVTSGLRRESLSSFCSSEKNLSYAIYRYDFLAGSKAKMNSFLQSIQRRKITFDDQFDLSTDSMLYCSEFVYKMAASAGYSLHHSIHNGKDYIGLDDLYCANPARLLLKNNY